MHRPACRRLSAATAEHAARLQALDAQARALRPSYIWLQRPSGPPSPTASVAERLRQDLATQERQSMEVQGSLCPWWAGLWRLLNTPCR